MLWKKPSVPQAPFPPIWNKRLADKSTHESQVSALGLLTLKCAKRSGRGLALLLILLLTSLLSSSLVAENHLPVSQEAPAREAQASLQYLGTAGVILSVAGTAVMTDPYLSNVSLKDWVLLRDLKPDKGLIRQTMTSALMPHLTEVRGLLLGHGHFDHLLDVPAVLPLLSERVKVYGSTTSLNQLAAAVPASRRIDVLPQALSLESSGLLSWIWITDSVRMLPLLSGHSYHVGHFAFAGGSVAEPLGSLPGDVLDWQGGEPLAYVLEWLDGDHVQFRALFLSSAADEPLGLPPQHYLDDKPWFDLVLLPVAKFQSVDRFPEGLLERINVRHLVLIHWEKFWQPYLPGREEAISVEAVQDLRSRLAALAPQARVYQPQRLDLLSIPLETRL